MKTPQELAEENVIAKRPSGNHKLYCLLPEKILGMHAFENANQSAAKIIRKPNTAKSQPKLSYFTNKQERSSSSLRATNYAPPANHDYKKALAAANRSTSRVKGRSNSVPPKMSNEDKEQKTIFYQDDKICNVVPFAVLKFHI